MTPQGAQLGVLAAGGVLVAYPVYASVHRGDGLPSARRITVPLVVVGGCALIATVAPVLGVGLAWLAALFLALNSQTDQPKPSRPVTGPLSTAPHVPGGQVPRTPHH